MKTVQELTKALIGSGFAAVPSGDEGLYDLHTMQPPDYKTIGGIVQSNLTADEAIAAVEALKGVAGMW